MIQLQYLVIDIPCPRCGRSERRGVYAGVWFDYTCACGEENEVFQPPLTVEQMDRVRAQVER
jgi:hypothetical protein